LHEDVFEDDASLVFHNSALKVIKDVIKHAIKHARYESITYYYKHELSWPMNTKIAKDFHLMKEQ
jgi:hypothetical protein